MIRILVLLAAVLLPLAVSAQDQRWIQIEAHPSLLEAEAKAREYANELPDISAHSLGSGWYAISMGPYDQDVASQQFNTLRATGIFPGDSFISNGQNYRQKIWPLGDTQTPNVIVTTEPDPVPTQPVEPKPTGETVAQARQSEAQLSRNEKRDLQRLLEWAGVYRGSIDGLFGRGTRNSMAAWQTENGYEPTGVMTTQQRQILLDQYNAIIADLGLATVTETTAGISMVLPLDRVEFSEYAAPMAHFRAPNGGAEQVFLISMPGNQDDLRALFEILQTLDVVALGSENKLNSRDFTMIGRTQDTYNYIQAKIEGDTIKGFGIVWPATNPEKYARLLSEMKNSFAPISGVLSPDMAQQVDLSRDETFGLDVRTPEFTRSGVYIGQEGQILSIGSDFTACHKILVEGEAEASATPIDGTPVVLIRPKSTIAPHGFTSLGKSVVSRGQNVFLASFPFGGALSAPSVTQGELVEALGSDHAILSLEAGKNDLGGAVLDQFGNLVGLLDANPNPNRTLPAGTQTAVLASAFVQNPALAEFTHTDIETLSYSDDALAGMLSKSATFVECWGN